MLEKEQQSKGTDKYQFQYMATMQPKQHAHEYADGDEEENDFSKKRNTSNNRGAAQSEPHEQELSKNK